MVHTSEPGGSDISEALLSASYHKLESGGSVIKLEPGGSDIIVVLLSTSLSFAGSEGSAPFDIVDIISFTGSARDINCRGYNP